MMVLDDSELQIDVQTMLRYAERRPVKRFLSYRVNALSDEDDEPGPRTKKKTSFGKLNDPCFSCVVRAVPRIRSV